MHRTLEEHLEDICPRCGEKHEKEWKPHFTGHKLNLILDCGSCGYTLYVKRNFMSCGTDRRQIV